MIGCLLACWLGAPQAQVRGGDADRGEKLVQRLGCMECHTAHGKGAGVFAEVKAPEWAGIFGSAIEMESGETVRVNEAYLLKSITEPDAQVVKGYPAAKMPTRYALLPQKDLAALVAFIKGLTPSSSPDPAADPGGGAPVATTAMVAASVEDGPLAAPAAEAAVRIKNPDVAQTPPKDSDARRGEKLVQRLGCMECHTAHGKGAGVFAEVKAPEWAGIFGSAVEMESGETVKITEAYLLKSITEPDAQVVKGYPAAKMPTRYALLPQKDLAALVAFIKGLTPSSADRSAESHGRASVADSGEDVGEN